MRKLEFGKIVGADLKENEVTIELEEEINMKVCKVAIIRCDNIVEEAKIEEFVKSLNR